MLHLLSCFFRILHQHSFICSANSLSRQLLAFSFCISFSAFGFLYLLFCEIWFFSDIYRFSSDYSAMTISQIFDFTDFPQIFLPASSFFSCQVLDSIGFSFVLILWSRISLDCTTRFRSIGSFPANCYWSCDLISADLSIWFFFIQLLSYIVLFASVLFTSVSFALYLAFLHFHFCAFLISYCFALVLCILFTFCRFLFCHQDL
jgi:hypothetical protein